MGPCEAFYAGPVQHPLLLWAAAVLAFVSTRRRKGLHASVRRYCAGLTALSLVDAWLTANHVYGVGTLSGAAAGAVPLFFVLAGDFRFLLLLGAATPEGTLAPTARRLGEAAALTCIVPILSQLVAAALPASASEPRVLFLVYELLFFALTAGLMAWHPGARSVAWLAPVGRFVLLYYGLWAAADALLLASGADLGFALRVVPNLLYYGGLIAVIGRAAERARS